MLSGQCLPTLLEVAYCHLKSAFLIPVIQMDACVEDCVKIAWKAVAVDPAFALAKSSCLSES